MKPRLAVSFSGGQTSGYMTWWILSNLSDAFDIVVTFANTSEEDERCLRFVHRCDVEFGFNTVWLEAVVDPIGGNGTRHRIVTFETASRNGEPFEAVIRKYGIPNKVFPVCNRELKLRPMQSYLRSIGWEAGSYHTAIGIRADEAGRISKTAERDKLIYPFAHPNFMPVTKADVNDWWEDQTFQLGMLEHEGNCRWCWKKSIKKHLRLIQEAPHIFDFPRRMEATYPDAGPGEGKRVFFRERRSTNDLFALAAELGPLPARARVDLDADFGCSESCEPYGTES